MRAHSLTHSLTQPEQSANSTFRPFGRSYFSATEFILLAIRSSYSKQSQQQQQMFAYT